jgi:hypothetical protein
VRHDKRGNPEQRGSANRLPAVELPPKAKASLPDWREVGRQVLSESMRRTVWALRRRNRCKPRLSHFRRSWWGLS